MVKNTWRARRGREKEIAEVTILFLNSFAL